MTPAADIIRIRKYPNRRLYDTSRSTHLTHDEVLAIVRRGQRVQISDSRTETDITNEVLLQILVARDPSLVASLPTAALFAVARSTPDSIARSTEAFDDLADALRASVPAASSPYSANGVTNGTSNGHANGHANGHSNGHSNGHTKTNGSTATVAASRIR